MLKTVEVGDWFRARRSDKFIIARVAWITQSNANAYEFWFDTRTEEAETLAYDQIGTGTGEIRFYSLGKYVKTDGTNVSDELVEEIQGTNESKTFTGYTRVNTYGYITGTGEWSWSGADNTSLVIAAKADELAEIKRRFKHGHFVKFGSLELRVEQSISVQNHNLTATVTKVGGEIPALNSSSVLVAEGDDIHRSEVKEIAFSGKASGRVSVDTGPLVLMATCHPLTIQFKR